MICSFPKFICLKKLHLIFYGSLWLPNYCVDFSVFVLTSGGSMTQNLWGQPVEAEGPSHICYSKIPLVLSKPVGPDGPTDYT
jgi:hypothetical protein